MAPTSGRPRKPQRRPALRPGEVYIEGAAERTGFAVSYLYKLTSKATPPERRIPHHRRGRTLIFVTTELDAWLQQVDTAG